MNSKSLHMHLTESYPHTSFLIIFHRDLDSRSRPDAILVTPYQAKPTPYSPSSSSSHNALRRHPTLRISGANRTKQPHQLNVNQRHVHLIEIKYCKDTRPGHQSEVAQRQHSDLCKLTSAKVVTLHTILLGVGGTCYREHTLNHLEQLGLDQHALKLARSLHAHSVQYAHKLVTTRRAIENSNTSHNQILESDASSNPPDPHQHSCF
eukprot:1161238-Pelagomonas_calceolata.AAC.3